MDLKINADDLNACVQCGLCLPHCPTYRVTGDEALSPRGRIHLMREVQDNDAPVTTEVVDAFDTCVQCRGCEPACPSGVPYGRLIESTRAVLADTGAVSTRRQRLAFWALSRPRTLRLGSTLLAVAARLRLVPERLGVPTDLPFTRGGRHTSGDDIYLFTGCVMDAWQRDVHDAGQRVLEAAGVGVTPTGDLAPCCGALHTHAGLGDPARAASGSDDHGALHRRSTDPRRLGRLRRRHEGVRPPARHTGSRGLQRPGVRHSRMARDPTRRSAGHPQTRPVCRRPGSLPSTPRATSPRRHARRARPLCSQNHRTRR